MLLAAMGHAYSFPHTPFHINIPHYSSDRGWLNAFLAMWDVSDVRQDVSDHFGVVGSSLSRRLRGRSAYHMTRGTTPHAAAAATAAQSSESEYLIQPVKTADADNSTSNAYGGGPSRSGINNRYGAFDAAAAATGNHRPIDSNSSSSKYDAGITIIKQSTSTKDYSPQYGAPKTSNYFRGASSTTSISSTSTRVGGGGGVGGGGEKSNSDNTTATTTTTSGAGGGGGAVGTFTGLNTTAAVGFSSMRKSDSTASDWLSTPTEEMLGIDVKGLEKDSIFYNA